MIKFNSCIVGFLCFGFSLLAQNKDQVLFTINDQAFFSNDFERIYKKNIDLVIDQNQKDLVNYLDMYVIYKLKVLKAQENGFDKKESFINELNIHRNELAKNFVYDSQITESLLNEAYDRYKTEVKASHILLNLPENPSAKDTLAVYNKALAIRDRILKGEAFKKVAQQVSDDPSAQNNGGDLGYFSAFKMVYPFENAAYNTQVGEVSMPVRTKFGYHLIQVTDKRDNRGQVSVRHILLTEDLSNPELAKNKIQQIYSSLLAGEKFDELAKNHSNDSYSAVRGGLLQPFVSGDLSVEEFEDQAFALQVPGEFSKPFKSSLGWHIVKLEYKKAPDKLLDIKNYLEGRILRDERSKKIESAVIEKAKKTYTYKINEVNLKALIKTIDVNKFNHEWKLSDNSSLNNKPLLIIDNNKVLNVNDFVKFMTLHTNNSSNVNPISKFVNNTFNNFINSQLVIYLTDNLEKTDSEFKDLVTEYREGLLIFSILEQDIWDKAKTDTIGLKKYFEENKQKYILPKRYKADIYSTTNLSTAKKVAKMLKKGKDISEIENKFKASNHSVLVRSDIFETTNEILPKGIDETKPLNNLIQQNNYYYIVKLNEIIPERVLNFDEAYPTLVSDYQQELENTWSDRLKQEYNIKIDQSVFNDLKVSLSKNQ